jgi:hypothetical protein
MRAFSANFADSAARRAFWSSSEFTGWAKIAVHSVDREGNASVGFANVTMYEGVYGDHIKIYELESWQDLGDSPDPGVNRGRFHAGADRSPASAIGRAGFECHSCRGEHAEHADR